MPAALPSLRDFRSAVIIKPSSLGDIVHTLPAVKALRDAHPHLKIRWLANTEWMPILQGSPLIDEVIPFPRKTFRGLAGLLRFWNWRRTWMCLPREEPEIVLDFQGLLRSGLASSWRGSQSVVGLSDAREGAHWFYNHTVPVNAGAHAVDRYLELPRALGIKIEPEDITFELTHGAPPAGWPESLPGFIALHSWSSTAKQVVLGTLIRSSSIFFDTLQTRISCLDAVMKISELSFGKHTSWISPK